ncbi:MAG TPA: hypothetical protein VF831_03395 [Anaerolineales bacterium]
MVHALKEAWRTLIPHGRMIDVRPLSIDVPLEIVYQGGSEEAGMVDMSPDIDLDISADNAITTVISEGLYTQLNEGYFNFTYYWKTIKGMEDDIEEFWQGEVNIPEQVWQRAHQLFNQQCPKTKIRLATRMKLGMYEKKG